MIWLFVACTGETDSGEPDDTAPAPAYDFTWPDPISAPETATLDPADFASAATCAECHPDHYAEWRASPHAWAMVDPVFQALVDVRHADFAGEQDAFCTQCHSNVATRGGEIAGDWSWGSLSPIALEGVTCVSCHTITDVLRTNNAGHQLGAPGTYRGSILDADPRGAHAVEGDPLFGESRFCASCHDVAEVSGLPLERPYAEWLTSPAAADQRPCQSCHAPATRAPVATGGAERDRHDHRFTGVDLPLVEGFLSEDETAEVREGVASLLAAAASLELALPADVAPGATLDLRVTVRNDIDGHNFPTGTTFLRQVWLEVSVTDATGATVYQSGDLDGNGDLRDRWSALDAYGDADLVTLHSGFLDDDGEPTLFTHLAAEHATRSIPPLDSRTFTYFVPLPDTASGPLTVNVRLRFRSVAPFLLRALELDPLADQVEIWDIDAVSGAVPLTP